jgi:hypothetical protein
MQLYDTCVYGDNTLHSKVVHSGYGYVALGWRMYINSTFRNNWTGVYPRAVLHIVIKRPAQSPFKKD